MSDKNPEIKKLSGPMLEAKSEKAKQLVILLHGYGSNGNDMISLSQFWCDILPDAMFIAPNAPDACDINPMGHQWFALDTSQPLATNDISRLEGAKHARPIIVDFLNDVWLATSLSAKDTILVGFSQGAMMALEVGLRLDEDLMGIIAFSGGLANPKDIKDEITSKAPVCFVHGGNDDVVPVGMSVVSSEELKKIGVETKLHISPGAGHSIAQDGLEFATDFIKDIVGE